MIRLLLGMLLGAAAASMMKKKSSSAGSAPASGRVDELTSAADNIVADPPVNVGDGTPGRTATTGV